MKQLLPGLVLLASALGTYGQSYYSDQIYSSPVLHNPAFTGYTGSSRIVGQYRYVFDDPPDNPWYNDNTHDYQYSVAYDRYLAKSGVGLGLNIIQEKYFHDPYNRETINTAGLTFSKRIVVRDNFKFVAGGSISYLQSKREEENYPFKIRLFESGNVNTYTEILHAFHTSVGVLLQGKKLTTALAATHLGNAEEWQENYYDDFEGGAMKMRYQFQMVYQETWRNDRFGYAVDLNIFRNEINPTISLGNTFRYRWACAGVRYVLNDYPSEAFVYYLGYRGQRLSVNLSHGAYLNYAGVADFWDHPTSLSVGYQFARKEGRQTIGMTPLIPF